MNFYRNQIQVGLLVTGSLLVLTILLLSIGQIQFFNPTKNYFIYFNFANGLEVNAPVHYAGVRVGRVEAIDIINPDEDNYEGRRIRVTIRVYDGVKVDRGARVNISTLGLMGEKYVELYPAPSSEEGFLEDQGTLVGEDPIQLKDLMDTGLRISSKLEETVSSINQLIGDERLQTNIKLMVSEAKDVIVSLKRAMSNVDSLLEGNKDHIQKIIVNLDQSTSHLQSFLANTEGLVVENRDDIRVLVGNLKETSASAKVFAAKIEKSPSSLVWKSREEKLREQEERKAAAAADKEKRRKDRLERR